jgi:hypothetical protein
VLSFFVLKGGGGGRVGSIPNVFPSNSHYHFILNPIVFGGSTFMYKSRKSGGEKEGSGGQAP